MNIIKKALGKVLYVFAEILSIILDALIGIVEVVIILVNSITRGFITFLGIGGCLLFFILSGPLGIFLLFNPGVMLTILFFIVFPLLGTKFISYLKYLKYMVTEFLMDLSKHFMHNTPRQFTTIFEYGNKYKKAEEAKRQKEQQERQAQQQKEWEERFRQWQNFQNSQRGNGQYYGGYQWHGQNHGFNNQSSINPTIDFKSKYEKSCTALGVDYKADKYQIKLAYRKKAKEYHPDINKSPDATKKFQEINDAYEFLSEENIERYQKFS